MAKNIFLLMLMISAVNLAHPFLAEGANPSHQTILSPSSPRKVLYPRIVIYTVAWCPHCRELKEYLTSRNIPFINKDVDLDTAAMEELVQKYSTYGVPVVVIGNDQEVLKGFSGDQFEKAVARVRSGISK